ncbi:serine O-acetyltransferase EpsC [Zestomonas thermotolerans]|uniref:serine O-acetyltransferase EpsC n=1 Tax=Zestomonas thermotolerans TaxID=157784 RepID=UPI0023F4315A|nr:serine O-acetyltransferase EpsC [Pseudomonas thermotolerans]
MTSMPYKLSPDQLASRWPLAQVTQQLREARQDWRKRTGRSSEADRELPSPVVVQTFVTDLCGALFPMRLGPEDLRHACEEQYVALTLKQALDSLYEQARLELRYATRQARRDEGDVDTRAEHLVREFAEALPAMRRLLDSDVIAAYKGDPAARSVDEVLLCYPGVLAVIHHRIAHHLYCAGLPLLARIIAELAHSATGIDIHPGAQIGGSFFIDHGTGVVIGETAIIGERVRLYQAVTLGAKRFESDEQGQLLKGQPRHPIVEDDVVIYAGATILGRITIGAGSTIGGNVWITRSVPPGSSVTQASLQQECGRQSASDDA